MRSSGSSKRWLTKLKGQHDGQRASACGWGQGKAV